MWAGLRPRAGPARETTKPTGARDAENTTARRGDAPGRERHERPVAAGDLVHLGDRRVADIARRVRDAAARGRRIGFARRVARVVARRVRDERERRARVVVGGVVVVVAVAVDRAEQLVPSEDVWRVRNVLCV